MPSSPVAQTPVASSAEALAHFASRLSYARSHVPGALSLPHRQMTAERMADWPEDTLFVVYCAGPHCNGGDRAALRLAGLGRPVKLMLGGMTGWADEGFAYASGDAPGSVMDAGIPVTQAG